jgi:hypothetical protein
MSGGYLNLAQVLSFGQQKAATSLSLSYSILAASTAIAFAFEYLGMALPGQRGNRSPWLPLFYGFGFLLMLLCYGKVTNTILGTSQALTQALTQNMSADQYLDLLSKGIQAKFATENAGPVEIAGNWAMGILATGVTVIVVLCALAIVQILYFLQAVLFSILIALGPLVIAFSAMPGASRLMGNWLRAICSVAAWPVIAGCIFDMALSAGIAQYNTASGVNWAVLVITHIAFGATLIAVPWIASSLVGSGFGALGPMIGAIALKQASVVARAPGNISRGVKNNVHSAKQMAGLPGRAADLAGKVGGGIAQVMGGRPLFKQSESNKAQASGGQGRSVFAAADRGRSQKDETSRVHRPRDERARPRGEHDEDNAEAPPLPRDFKAREAEMSERDRPSRAKPDPLEARWKEPERKDAEPPSKNTPRKS